MKKISKFLILIFSVAIIFSNLTFLSACSKKEQKTKIVCTIYPIYDWVCEIVGEEKSNFELTLLLNNGTDIHSYQPTVADIAKIATADIFIYVGGESDEWVDDALKNATNKDMVVINLLEVLGDNAKEEESKDGMQDDEHTHKHEHEHEEDEHEHEEEVEYDEHVWLSLKNTKIFINEFANEIGAVDIANKDTYLKNANDYISKLDALDNEYQSAVDNGSKNTLLFGDRFPFLYLVKDYGLDYFAAFKGCSAETEASFETITFLSSKMNELNLKVILKLETSDDALPISIKNNCNNKNNIKILTLNSIQNTTLKSKTNYLKIMTSNLEVLKEALS